MIASLIRALVRAIDRTRGIPYCRACGCTQNAACPGGCWWVEPDLCSSCEDLALVLAVERAGLW